MAASVKDVAARAGVSVGTVSNVLNRPGSVKQATVDKVDRAIAELGFVPNGAARQLRAGISRSIALVVLDVGNPFFTDMARGTERRAHEEGLSVLLANSDENAEHELRHLETFERQRVFGVLVSPVGDDLAPLRRIRDRGIPVVLVDRGSEDPTFASVSVDDEAGGAIAARHLLDLGRRRLAFVGGPLRIRQVADRYRGAVAEVNKVAGASMDFFETQALSLDEGRLAGLALRERARTEHYDGVFAANDLLAIGIEQALLGGEEPLSIPHEVALVGYDDISFAAAAVVPITSVRQPRELIGATAFDLLLAERDRDEGQPRERVIFQPELAVRASTIGS